MLTVTGAFCALALPEPNRIIATVNSWDRMDRFALIIRCAPFAVWLN
jgi:hypothetical protein